ncbi:MULTISPECIES: hypothetical protein [unclassified Flavobacterium]|uniref:hypothetical protein n=1 Tax=unclassified Flavobacterium TaxID=196869 RepID=UPI00086C56F2|nr:MULTISPECIES: hypothetical protein [unclassified Flavobacterium]MBN9283017.1 hypothetical protein [Flavobacterium sp.]ODS82226.1 MAG: hypothetical protein ABS44_18500 [Chryseobacterium sp. SCN 40-13]OJV67652.1 MAG: hypothetical protein BGO42_16600 [Flavobacterium sp. 40-81]
MSHRKLHACFPVMILIVFVLFGCELERDAINKKSYQEKLSIRNSTFDMLLKEEQFITALSKLNKGKQKKGSIEKTVMEDAHGFSIMPDIAKVIQDDAYTTYTFQIKREISNPTFFENLVISMDSLNQANAYLVKYTPTVPLTPSEEHHSFHFKGTVNIKQIEYDITPTAKELNCVTATVWMCNQAWTAGGSTEPHVATQYCNDSSHLFSVTTVDCSMSIGGGGNSGAGGSGDGGFGGGGLGGDGGSTGGNTGGGHSGGGSGGSNSNTNPPVVTTPILDEIESTAPPSGCKTITKQLEKFPNLKEKLIDLAGTTSQSNENGIFIDKSATTQTSNPVQTIPQGIGGMIDINMNPSQKYVMLAHTHDAYGGNGNGTYSIFSWDDMAVLSRLVQNDKIDTGDFVFYVITADGTRYALTIDCTLCIDSFRYPRTNAQGTILDMKKIAEMEKLFKKYYGANGTIKVNSNVEDDKKSFLEFIKEAKLGLNLFEVDATFSDFQKLEFDSKTSNIIKKPCSN